LPVLECSRCNELFYSASGSTFARCERCGGEIWRIFEDEGSFDRVADLPRTSQPGDHGAIVYSDSGEAADFCVQYVREGIALGELVVGIVPQALRSALERRLSAVERAKLELEDPVRAYADFDPRRLIAWYEDLVAHSGKRVRVLAGPDADSAAKIPIEDWRLFERLIHERVHELGVTGLCVYDGPFLPGDFIPVAMRAHPLLVRRSGELRRNGEFRWDGPLADPRD
jgi:hypothetical protein